MHISIPAQLPQPGFKFLAKRKLRAGLNRPRSSGPHQCDCLHGTVPVLENEPACNGQASAPQAGVTMNRHFPPLDIDSEANDLNDAHHELERRRLEVLPTKAIKENCGSTIRNITEMGPTCRYMGNRIKNEPPASMNSSARYENPPSWLPSPQCGCSPGS
jgi:hypothetical protein